MCASADVECAANECGSRDPDCGGCRQCEAGCDGRTGRCRPVVGDIIGPTTGQIIGPVVGPTTGQIVGPRTGDVVVGDLATQQVDTGTTPVGGDTTRSLLGL